MKPDTSKIAKFYLTAGIWFFVMLSMALGAREPVSVLHSALGTGPELRAATTMIIAISVAFIVAAVVWRGLGRVGRANTTAQQRGNGLQEADGAEGALATIR